MEILSKDEALLKKDYIIKSLREGKIFIYPTDTIYGIGCNALLPGPVLKIRDAKERQKKPFSVISPGKGWIEKNCFINEGAKQWIDMLPGPYTLIFKARKGIVDDNVIPGTDTLGVRIPDSWFSMIVAEAGVPVVTTSVNRSGMDYMTSLEDLDNSIRHSVDIMIYDGELKGRPSKIIDLVSEDNKVIER